MLPAYRNLQERYPFKGAADPVWRSWADRLYLTSPRAVNDNNGLRLKALRNNNSLVSISEENVLQNGNDVYRS
jgi:hypothetical protein